MTPPLVRRVLAELIGTGFLVAAAFNPVVTLVERALGAIDSRTARAGRGPAVRVVFGALRSGRTGSVAYAVGGYITAAYWFTSSTSFANPAVTVARMLSDSFAGVAPASVPGFVLMQLLGGLVALGLVKLLYPQPAALVAQLTDDPTGRPRTGTETPTP